MVPNSFGETAMVMQCCWKTRALRVLIVDDHAVVRHSLARLLQSMEKTFTISEAEDGPSAIRMVADRKPDVVLMDYQMPGMNGAETTRRLGALAPRVPVIGFSMHDEIASRRMLAAGARRFFPKDGNPEDLVTAIHETVDCN